MNLPLELHSGPLRLRDGAAAPVLGTGRVYVAWQPTPRLQFTAALKLPLFPSELDVSFMLGRHRAKGPVFVTRTRSRFVGGRATGGLEGHFSRRLEVGNPRRLAEMALWLPNVPPIDGLVSVVTGPWTLSLGQWASDDELKLLRDEGGYAMTAVATIARTDGRPFNAATAGPFVESFWNLVSFASGSWTQPVVSIGVDASGAHRWGRWDTGRISQWEPRHRWLPQRHHQPAVDLLPAWHARWRDPYWNEVIGRVVYLFLAANQRNVDVGLVLAQSALETLSYAVSVVEKKSISPKAFDARGYSAAHKIRGLLADLRLPDSVPPSLAALDAFSPQGVGQDGPSKITWLRNRLVHPLKSAPSRAHSQETTDAWRLAMWYAESSLLTLMGYRGHVWNRVATAYEAFP